MTASWILDTKFMLLQWIWFYMIEFKLREPEMSHAGFLAKMHDSIHFNDGNVDVFDDQQD